MTRRTKIFACIALLIAACVALAASANSKLIGGAYDYGGGSYWTEADTTAPTLVTDGFALYAQQAPGAANRLALLVDLGTRDSWGFRVFCYAPVAAASNNAGWFQIEPAETNTVAVTTSGKNITAVISADTVVAFELGSHCARIDLQHASVNGTATTKARAYVIGR